MIDVSFTPFPLLATENYALRNLTPEDAQEIFALRSSDEINKYLDRPKANTPDDALSFITKIINGIAKNEAIFWVVTPKGGARFLGSICLWQISREEAKAEIGYELLPENHGKGIMQEVIPRVIQFGFEEMKLQTIEAELSPRNLKSVRLLEKNNFTLAEENPDSVVYALKSDRFIRLHAAMSEDANTQDYVSFGYLEPLLGRRIMERLSREGIRFIARDASCFDVSTAGTVDSVSYRYPYPRSVRNNRIELLIHAEDQDLARTIIDET